jgi:endonuclease/exonuclease/phosphatase family metal-dependent hydrolase
MRLRVLTLNVWNEEGNPQRSDLINSELRRLDPDLIALQEVVQTGERNQLKKDVD